MNHLHPEYAGLPVELMAKLNRDGNPAEFLTMDDVVKIRDFITGQRSIINGQQNRIDKLLQERDNLAKLAGRLADLIQQREQEAGDATIYGE